MKILNVKKAEEKTTELVFIIDRSGSMAGLEKDTITLISLSKRYNRRL